MRKMFTLMIGLLCTAMSCLAALPAKVYAPYVDVMLWPTFNIVNASSATGQKYFTLAFIIAGTDNQPAWGGALNMSSNHMLDQVNQLRAAGGDVIVSFGGANGTPIDASITNVSSLVAAYSTVIDKYGLTWIDFDIEGWWVQDQASIDRRNQAARQLQIKYPSLRITYCLPVMPTGLTADGINIINKAKAAGVNIYGVNVMAMDYGQSNQQMGSAAISAAQNTRNQTGLNIGITPMIGKNDTQNETFTLSNASQVMSFAQSTSWVNMLAMWSVNRDNGGCAGNTSASPTCSGLSQSQYAFVNIFKPFSGGTTGCTPTAIQPYLSVNGGAWQTVTSASLAVGGSVTIGPQPLSGGSWRWAGPNSFSSTSRQITISNIQTNQGGGYSATYTNAAGCNSSLTFTITVTGGTTGGCTGVAQYVENGGYVAGSNVKNAGNRYECKPYPYSGWCNGAAWAYAPGTGTYWQDAWILKSSCTAGRSNVSQSDRLFSEGETQIVVTDADGLALFPNPAKNNDRTITINFEKAPGNVKIHMRDINGSEAYRQDLRDIKTQSIQVLLPQLPHGLYFIRVSTEQQSWVRKYLIPEN
jgi:hypothetical protein